MKSVDISMNNERNVSLTGFLVEVGPGTVYDDPRPAVIVIPGGAYQICSPRESDPVAAVYLAAGFHAFILNYSVGEHAVWPRPLEDYEEAMALVREHADEWGVDRDKIALVGFSAGGHLAAAAGTLSALRPAALVLGYPVTKAETAHRCEETAPDIVSNVDGDTPPCFIFATRTDPSVPIDNTLEFALALSQHDIPFECHIYAYGPHGFSTGDPAIGISRDPLCPRARSWTSDSVCWLKEIFSLS